MGEATPRPLPRAGLREFVTLCCVVIAFIALAIVVADILTFAAVPLVWVAALSATVSTRFWEFLRIELRPALRYFALGAVWLWTFDLSLEGLEPIYFVFFVKVPLGLFLVVNAVIGLIYLVRLRREPVAWLTALVALCGLLGGAAVLDAKQTLLGHYFATDDELREQFAAEREGFRALETQLASESSSAAARSKIQRLARELGLEWDPKHSEGGHRFEVWQYGLVPEGASMAFIFDRFANYTTVGSVVEGRERALEKDPRNDDFTLYLDLGGGWYLRYEHW